MQPNQAHQIPKEAYTLRAMDKDFTEFADSQYHGTGSTADNLPKMDDNIISYYSFALNIGHFDINLPALISYDFNTPQFITKYKIWSRASSGDRRDEAPKRWELRASADKTTYENGTFETLHFIDITHALGTSDWYNHATSGIHYASDNLDIANTYQIPSNKQGSYQYYVLYITDNCGDSQALGIGEWALYGQEYPTGLDDYSALTDNSLAGP